MSVAASRTTADARGDVVVLLIGMRVNHFWAVHQWVPVMLAMLRMLAELKKDPGRGLLSRVLLTASPRTYYVVQYWESKEKLYAYASAPDAFHHRAWAKLNRMEREREGARARGDLARDVCRAGGARTRRSTATCRRSASRPRTGRSRWGSGGATRRTGSRTGPRRRARPDAGPAQRARSATVPRPTR